MTWSRCAMAMLAFVLLTASVSTQAPHENRQTRAVPPAWVTPVKLHEQAVAIWNEQQKNLALQLQILQMHEAQLNARGAELQADRTVLDDKIKDAVDAPKDATVDWSKSPPVVVWSEK